MILRKLGLRAEIRAIFQPPGGKIREPTNRQAPPFAGSRPGTYDVAPV
jgi:hypothetical protein